MDEHLTKDERKRLRQEEWKQKEATEKRKKKMSKIIWWAGGAAALVLGVWFIYAMVNTPTQSIGSLTAPAPVAKDMTFGNPKAKVVLTEYADFQCPACEAYYPIVKQLTEQYKDRLFFVYRFFPLTQVHQNALTSSEAGYAASLQGKFWPMHDLLFEHQTEWATVSDPTPLYMQYAKDAGLNLDKFTKDYNSSAVAKYVGAEQQKALDLGLPGTPSFFLNGKQIANPANLDAFKKLIDDALASAK